MGKGILKIAFRTIWKRKFYTFINVLGLSIGIASVVFILLYLRDELSYDKFHEKYDKIYRVCRIFYTPGYIENAATCSFPLAPNLKKTYPDHIEEYVRFFNFQLPALYVQYKKNDSLVAGHNESRFYFADTNIFNVMTYQFVHGDRKEVFEKTNSVILTESAARRYFGSDDPIGEKLILEELMEFEVTAVIKDVPEQTHLAFDFIASMESVKDIYGGGLPDTWVWNPCWTYVVLKDTIKPEMLLEKLPNFYDEHYYDFQDEDIKLYLQPIADIHLRSHLDLELSQNSYISHVYILSIVGLFVIIIACINFINLTTATSSGRAREVAIKKVIGVLRSQLIFQFIIESIIVTFIAIILSIVFVEALFPFFQELSGKNISHDVLLEPPSILFFGVSGIVLGLLSGVYPAFYLSGFRPLSILKTRIVHGVKSGMARKILVTVQYAISIALIISSVLVIYQIHYINNANLGFNKDEIIVIPSNRNITQNYNQFKKDLLLDSSVYAVTGMDELIGIQHNTWGFKVEGLEEKVLFYPALMVRENFVKTFDLTLISGEDFSRKAVDTNMNGVIINESMAKSMGWEADEAIGKRIEVGNKGQVIGVVKDFNALSLHKPIGDFMLGFMNTSKVPTGFTRYIAIRLSIAKYDEAMSYIESTWSKYAGDRPMNHSFLNVRIQEMYENEEKFRTFSLVLTAITIFIANLGTFALTSFLAEQKTKEIGMRRVLGANIANILQLFSKEIILLVGFSSIIAWPLAYLIIKKWFGNFSFTVAISWWIFIVATLISLFIALITVWTQAYWAAKNSPVKALRYE